MEPSIWLRVGAASLGVGASLASGASLVHADDASGARHSHTAVTTTPSKPEAKHHKIPAPKISDPNTPTTVAATLPAMTPPRNVSHINATATPLPAEVTPASAGPRAVPVSADAPSTSAGTTTLALTSSAVGTPGAIPHPAMPSNPLAALVWGTFRQRETDVSPTPIAAVVTASTPVDTPLPGTPSLGTPDSATGSITGTTRFSDPAGRPLSYTVSTKPAKGSVAVTAAGGFTYTPTVTARKAAGTTLSPVIDTFTIKASNGTASATEKVTVTVSPIIDTPVAGLPTVSKPNPTTGIVTGAMKFTDPAHQTLHYTVSGAPVQGTVTVSTSGAYTYTPTVAARLLAADSPTQLTETFTVSATNAVASTAETVTVPITPGVLSVTKNVVVGSDPITVAVTPNGKTAYVLNLTTLSVIKTSTNTVVKTVTVTTPANTLNGLAISPDGKTVYVAVDNLDTDAGSVAVIKTATNKIASTIPVGYGPTGLAVSPDSATVYVANADDGTVSIINTTTSAVSTVNLGGNTVPMSIAFSANGNRAYVVDAGSNAVSIIDTTTHAVTAVGVGNQPYAVAISPDGTHAYVTNQADNSVSLIDTATNAVSSISVGDNPLGVASSPDGGTVYVTNGFGNSVSVIDVATKAVVGTIPASTGAALLGVNPKSGAVYVANGTNALSVMSIRSITATDTPVAGIPAMSSPDAATGAVSGVLGVTDPAGKTLAYTVTTKPTKGIVTVSKTGTFTYTPTISARLAAAKTTKFTTDTFTVTATNGVASATENVTVTVTPDKPVTGTPVVGKPDSTTGTVTGTVTFTDPAGQPLTYTVTSQPNKGSVTLSTSGAFTYTPTAAARSSANGSTTDTFTVTANNGAASASQIVTVPVSPIDTPVAAFPQVGAPNTSTGVVTGRVVFFDAQGKPLTYSLRTQPSNGSVTVDSTGNFSYTPTAAARLTAALSASPVTDTFVIAASNGIASTPETVTVTISPSQPDAGTLLGTISGLTGIPSQLGVSPDGTRVCITTDTGNVYVVNTANNAIIGQPLGYGWETNGDGLLTDPISFSPNSSRIYVTNNGGNVATINAVTGQLISDVNLWNSGIGAGIFASGTGSVISKDGSTLYAVGDSYVASAGKFEGVISLVNANNTTISSIFTFPLSTAPGENQPTSIALSPDGVHMYAASAYSSNLWAINLSTKAVTTMSMAGIAGLAVTPDGKFLYVTNGEHVVSVINTANNAVVNTVQLNTASYAPSQVKINADGSKVFVLDQGLVGQGIYGALTVIDTTSGLISTIQLNYYPYDLAINTKGTIAYISHYNTVSEIYV